MGSWDTLYQPSIQYYQRFLKINENWRGSQEWTIHWAHSTQYEDKQYKNTQDRKLERWATLTPLIPGGEPRCSRRVCTFSLLRDTRHGTHIVMYDTSMRNKENSTNKIYYLLQPTSGKDEPHIVFMRKS